MNIVDNLKKYSYFYILGVASLYAVFYTLYKFIASINAALCQYDDLISYFADVSILFFTGGIFTVSLKYFQFLGVFEKEFKKIVESDEFEKKLSDIIHVEEYLTKQNNLSDIWKKITLSMYKKEFPDIYTYTKLGKKIENEFFFKRNISYYYKNFQARYEFEYFDDDYVKTIETSSFTIVRPNEDEFQWDFGVNYDKSVDSKITHELYYEYKNCTGTVFADNKEKEEKGLNNDITYRLYDKLSGQTEYHIIRKISLVQDLRNDRTFDFITDRIIDDLKITIEKHKDLSIFFSSIYKSDMSPDLVKGKNELSYSSREIFLPGEKFKLFIYKNTKI